MRLQHWERAGLKFLLDRGSDCVGVIATEEQMAAALGWEYLRKKGLLSSTMSDNGPVYRLTPEGERAIKEYPDN